MTTPEPTPEPLSISDRITLAVLEVLKAMAAERSGEPKKEAA